MTNLHNFTVGAPLNTSLQGVKLPSAVTQTRAHEGVSGRYQFINTGALVERLEGAGLTVRQASQARSSKYDGFQRHIVRMTMKDVKVGDTVPEVVIIGSHNGTSTHQFRMGLYRLVCSNGLMVGSDIADFRIRHFGGNVQQIVEDALNDLHTQLPFVAERVAAMRDRNLSIDEMVEFAKQALALRVAPAKAVENNTVSLLETGLLVPRRTEDKASNLWEVYNRTQENIIRGSAGLRKITSPVRDVELNRGLWNIAEGFLKAA